MLAWGGFSFISSKQFTDKCSGITSGVVVNVEKNYTYIDKREEISYVATVEPNDGTIFNYTFLTSRSTSYAYTKGEHVVIHYDPSDLSTYYIQHADPSTGDLNLLIAGAVVLLLAFAFLGIYKKVK